jgi:hypothetical protein
MASRLPVSSFSAWVDWWAAVMSTAGPRTPAVSHVGLVPGGGGSGKMQRRQAVDCSAVQDSAASARGRPWAGWGRIGIDMPLVPTAPP